MWENAAAVLAWDLWVQIFLALVQLTQVYTVYIYSIHQHGEISKLPIHHCFNFLLSSFHMHTLDQLSRLRGARKIWAQHFKHLNKNSACIIFNIENKTGKVHLSLPHSLRIQFLCVYQVIFSCLLKCHCVDFLYAENGVIHFIDSLC